ncbi:hypothetical protein [Microlunatus sp. Y2014]|uniref:hypothetical protein n=1 Tax=Microlunatus sp. Y2014 TaxID=3418488 RepID=UPI003DA756AE
MPAEPADPTVQFATAVEVITPPAPMRLACTGDFASTSTSVHDDQYVRVLAVRAADGRVLLWVSYDLLFFDRALNRDLAEHARQAYGIDPAGVTVGAVHNHNAGAVAGFNPGSGRPEYEELLRSKGRAAIDAAMAHLRPGRLELRRTDIDLNIQRRQVTDGQATAGPNEGAPRDTELVLLTVTDADDVLAACVVVYACHPVFYPDKTVLTGEFPARLCQLLTTDRYGCTPLFFQGAAGDARPRASIVDGQFTPRPFEVVDGFARDLADEVLALLDQPGEPIQLAPRGVEFTVSLPLEPFDRQHFVDIAEAEPALPDHPAWTNAVAMAADYDDRPTDLSLVCTLVRLTADTAQPLYLATMGGEPVNDIKQLVRDAVDGPVVFVGYTDSTAYIVSDRMLPEGGYEVTCAPAFGHVGQLAAGIDERITAGFAAAVRDLAGTTG